jgi:hypothetical protein
MDTPPIELFIGNEIQLEKILEIFPKPIGNCEKLRITDIGLYSITKKNESFFISNLIVKYFGENKITVTDSTACCGGNTIGFLLNQQVQRINAIEIDELHFDILQNNVNLYKDANKVFLYNQNYLNCAKSLVQDVIFYDLPWGGKKYIEKDEINLGLNDNSNNFICITKIVNEMKDFAKLQILKVPLNFIFTHFLKEIDYVKIKIHKIYNKYTKKLCYFIIILIS